MGQQNQDLRKVARGLQLIYAGLILIVLALVLSFFVGIYAEATWQSEREALYPWWFSLRIRWGYSQGS